MPSRTVLIRQLVEAISPLLAGFEPEVQSAVLADLLAMWLAGHLGERQAVAELREQLLAGHIKLVRDLIPANEKLLLERVQVRGRG